MVNTAEQDFLGGEGEGEDEFRQENLVTEWYTTPQGNGLAMESLRDAIPPSGHGP